MAVAVRRNLEVGRRKPAVEHHMPVVEHRKLAVAFLDRGPVEGVTHKALVPVGDHRRVAENRMPFLNTKMWTDFLLLILIMRGDLL